MTTVWILSQGEDYEGGGILGVFASQELAIDYAETFPDLDRDGDRWEEWTGDECLTRHDSGCDWQQITPHEVME